MANKTLVSPAGIAAYPRLSTPDTKFDKRGTYKVTLRMTPTPEVQAFVKMLDEAANVALAKAEQERKESGKKGKPIGLADKSWYIDADSGEAVVSFKMLASGETRDGKPFTQRPALFDAKGTPLNPDTKVGGGSKLKVAFQINPFVAPIGAGISIRMKAVQVLELKAYDGPGADFYGFGEEDGFEAPAAETFASATETAQDETTSEDSATDF